MLLGFTGFCTGLKGSMGGGWISMFGRGVVGVGFGVHLVPLPVMRRGSPRGNGVCGWLGPALGVCDESFGPFGP